MFLREVNEKPTAVSEFSGGCVAQGRVLSVCCRAGNGQSVLIPRFSTGPYGVPFIWLRVYILYSCGSIVQLYACSPWLRRQNNDRLEVEFVKKDEMRLKQVRNAALRLP